MYRKDETETRWRELFSSADGGKIKEPLFNSQSNTYENMRQAMEERFNKNITETEAVLYCKKPYASGVFQCNVNFPKYTSADGWRYHKRNKRKSKK